jgi:GxxExxY protein
VKAMRAISDIEHAQLINYLRASGLWCALLLNFGSKSLSYRRLVHGPKPQKSV